MTTLFRRRHEAQYKYAVRQFWFHMKEYMIGAACGIVMAIYLMWGMLA